MNVDTDSKKIDEILTRSVAEILPSKEALKSALESGKRLKAYLGADVTGPELHIGHATNLILLEKLRQLGHEVIILFGDFTALIGDPSDKESERKMLSKDDVEKNIKTWKEQVSKVIDIESKENPAKILKNSEWLSGLDFSKIIELTSHFTVGQMIERDMFQKNHEL